jgi:hypothetical protein
MEPARESTGRWRRESELLGAASETETAAEGPEKKRREWPTEAQRGNQPGSWKQPKTVEFEWVIPPQNWSGTTAQRIWGLSFAPTNRVKEGH